MRRDRWHRLVAAALVAFAPGWTSARAGTAPGASPQTGSGVAHSPDVDLAYTVLGAAHGGVPLLVVNGGPGLTHAYMVQNDVWQRLSAARKIVFIDPRGMGGSRLRRADAPQGMDAQVSDVDAVRRAIGADRIDLLGDSFGGMVVLAYALAHPDHLHRLVVSDGLPSFATMVHLLPDVFPDLDAEAAARERGLDAAAAAQEDFRVHMRECFYDPDKAARYLATFRDLSISPAVNDAVSRAVENTDLSPQLHRIAAPTLVLTGRFDMNVAPITAWRMAQAIPGARFHAFERSGHLPAVEEPDAYVAEVGDFLAAGDGRK